MPIKRLMDAGSFGAGISEIAKSFLGSGSSPRALATKPSRRTFCCAKKHFPRLSRKFALFNVVIVSAT